MSKKQRNTVTYDLKRGNNVVYRGTTDDPERREQQHKESGKMFDNLKVTSRRMTENGAKSKESENLDRYRKGHGGKNPIYNENDDG